MNAIDEIAAELKSLPPDKQREVVKYVRRMKRTSRKSRSEAFRDLACALSAEEVEEIEKHIDAGCEQMGV